MEEKFLAFFNFKLPEGGIEGLCKIAEPEESKLSRYVSITLIADANSEPEKKHAQRVFEKLNAKAFQKYLPELTSITTSPLGRKDKRSYLYQIDLIFPKKTLLEPKTFVPLIAFSFRNIAQCKTEIPEWWQSSNP